MKAQVSASESATPDKLRLRSYGGEAGDTRVARRRAALLEAALDVLSESDAGALTVRGICARAGLTPRYFYESFEGADDLVGATYDWVIAEIAEKTLAGFDVGTDTRSKIIGGVRALVDVIDSDPRKGRLLFTDMLGSPVVAAKRDESVQFFVRLTSESAAQILGVPEGPETTAGAYFQVGGLGRVLAAWTAGDLDLDREQIVELCARLMLPGAR